MELTNEQKLEAMLQVLRKELGFANRELAKVAEKSDVWFYLVARKTLAEKVLKAGGFDETTLN